MLMPKRVKRRRVFRGRMKGKAMRGNFLAYGDFGLVATEPSWITSQQIEAARIAMTRYTKRGGQVWIKGGGGQARPRSVRDRGRSRGSGARGPASGLPQAAPQDQDPRA